MRAACSCCNDGVTTAPTASGPIAGGLAAPGLLAFIVVSKFVKHMPLYRRQRDAMLATAGWVLLGPLIMAVALIVYLKLGPPILIKELWIDPRGDTAEVLVFRTGPQSFLRRTSLDKLPRLINVMRGECGIEALWH
jgi:lipopolysaccharide/colanic/teichoic acid biosynthesis glycosyltransferase